MRIYAILTTDDILFNNLWKRLLAFILFFIKKFPEEGTLSGIFYAYFSHLKV